MTDETSISAPADDDSAHLERVVQAPLRRFFHQGFTAADIAMPLLTFDAEQPASWVADLARHRGADVIGVKVLGAAVGYAQVQDLIEGSCVDHLRRFRADRLVVATAPLKDVLPLLRDYPYCFVTAFGAVGGLIARAALQKPPVRMWVFGLVTLIEEALRRLIVQTYPDGRWTDALPAARLSAARRLKQERERRHDRAALVECLQFGDAAHIVFKNERLRTELGFESRRAAKEATKRVERLRNRLAHAQEIDDESIGVIANLATDLDQVLELL